MGIFFPSNQILFLAIETINLHFTGVVRDDVRVFLFVFVHNDYVYKNRISL